MRRIREIWIVLIWIVFYRVGVFATLTNSYALVAVGASENFYRYAHTSQSFWR